MDEYLFFQSHKGALGKEKDQLLNDNFAQSPAKGKDKTKMKFEKIITKLEEQYEGCKSPEQKINRALGIESPKKIIDEELKENKSEFTDETMKNGLENISEKYKN